MYKFVKILDPSNEFDKTNITVSIPYNDLDLGDLCEAFTDFLKACGFFIEGRHIDIVEDEELPNEEPTIDNVLPEPDGLEPPQVPTEDAPF